MSTGWRFRWHPCARSAVCAACMYMCMYVYVSICEALFVLRVCVFLYMYVCMHADVYVCVGPDEHWLAFSFAPMCQKRCLCCVYVCFYVCMYLEKSHIQILTI